MRTPWTALPESAASSTATPQAPVRTTARKTSFGRELEAALKHGIAVESVHDDRGTKFEGAALAIAMRLPDPVAVLPGTKHDLHPPHVIERDVFVRIVADRSPVKALLPERTPTPSAVAEPSQSEAKAPTELGAVTRESAPRTVADQAATKQARLSPARELPVPTMASRAQSFAPPLLGSEAVIDSSSGAVGRNSVDGLQQQMSTPHDPLPRDVNDDTQRHPAHTSSSDAAAVVHAGTEAGIKTARPQPVAESASNSAVPNEAALATARHPGATQSVAAPVALDANQTNSQAAFDLTLPTSVRDQSPDSETKHPPSAEPAATRDLVDAVGSTRHDKSTTVVHALEPAGKWPAPRVSAAEIPGAATERVVNQALDAVREITIDGLAQRKVLQPQRWSMPTETTQPCADKTQSDSGTHQGPASDSETHDQDHADPPTAHKALAPNVQVGSHGGFNAALQQSAAESVSSTSVAHAAVAASASPPATAPIAAVVPRLDANPATVQALVEQVVHRLLDAPANGTVTLRLDPPELGTLLVRFQRRGSQLSVTMTAEREDVSRLLRQGLGQLQSSLRQLHEQVSVQVDTHGESRGRGEDGALGSRRQREPESRQNEPAHDQGATSSRETPAQRAKRAMRAARLDVWS